MKENQVQVDVWGELALFTMPNSKIERVSYLVPTPSAMRGVLSSVYSKPAEFYWQIDQIEIMKDIRTISIAKNEVKYKLSRNGKKIINTQIDNTPKSNLYLYDVYYRVTASIILNSSAEERVNVTSLKQQFLRRVVNGKCFASPFLGTRECMAHISLPNRNMRPVDINKDFGNILYDVFDIDDTTPLDTAKGTGHTNVRFFPAVAEHGIIKIPTYEEMKERTKGHVSEYI